MLIFDGFRYWFEPKYEYFKNAITSFDQTYEMWRIRQLKWQEWKEKRKRQEEIYSKSAEKDQLS